MVALQIYIDNDDEINLYFWFSTAILDIRQKVVH